MYDHAQDPNMQKVKSNYAIKTRSSNKIILRVKRPLTERFKKCIAYGGPKKWNRLPEAYHHAPNKQSFKTLVDKMIKEKSEKARLSTSLSTSLNASGLG